MRCWASFVLLLVLGTLSGCAHYEFDLVRPAELSRHIGDDSEQIFKLDPLEYRMQSSEGRLVVKIFNPTSDSIVLMGRRSSVVDPQGQSHPLMELAIAAHSFVKMVLPPFRPQIESSGPTIGIGFGVVGYHRARAVYSGWAYDPYYYDEPRYYDVYDANDSRFWDWEGQSDVRLFLSYQRGDGGGREFHHEFLIHRKKM